MIALEDIIQFENENTTLDFKAIQYKSNKYEDFLKDIISMANSKSNQEKFIIIGVNHKANGDRDIIGISEDFVDDSRYQQLVNENVEPEIDFKYYPYEFNSTKIGIFQIQNCSNPPYMMKKKFGNLEKGDSFIRKGSHQTKLVRSDYDYFYNQKILDGKFTGKIVLNFENSGSKVLVIKRTKDFELPSKKAEIKIKKIIKEKEEILEKQLSIGLKLPIIELPILGVVPYESRSISTLKNDLDNVKKNYYKEDLFYIYEEKSNKINLTIFNNGNEYLEDSSIEVQFIENESILIAESVYQKPIYRSWMDSSSISNIEPNFSNMHYPTVNKTEKGYIVLENLGNIKHNIPTKVFKVPIRFVALQNCIDKEITLKIKIFGKNLPVPFEDELKIIVNE